MDWIGFISIKTGCALTTIRLLWLGVLDKRRLVIVKFQSCVLVSCRNVLSEDGSRNKLRRSSTGPRITCRQYFETVRARVRDLLERCDRITSKSST